MQKSVKKVSKKAAKEYKGFPVEVKIRYNAVWGNCGVEYGEYHKTIIVSNSDDAIASAMMAVVKREQPFLEATASEHGWIQWLDALWRTDDTEEFSRESLRLMNEKKMALAILNAKPNYKEPKSWRK